MQGIEAGSLQPGQSARPNTHSSCLSLNDPVSDNETPPYAFSGPPPHPFSPWTRGTHSPLCLNFLFLDVGISLSLDYSLSDGGALPRPPYAVLLSILL